MKTLNIEQGLLFCDVDVLYDKDNNKLDVYCSKSWWANDEEEYNQKEKLITDFSNETDLFQMKAWCDSSGYDYWIIQQEEENYVSIDVILKKPHNEYTQEEIQIIANAISKADDYFSDNL